MIAIKSGPGRADLRLFCLRGRKIMRILQGLLDYLPRMVYIRIHQPAGLADRTGSGRFPGYFTAIHSQEQN
jgi:hypothetical protein